MWLMENLLIPQVIVETPAYLRAVADFWDSETQSEFKNFIGVNFLLGDIIPDTGGLRKIRWQGSGRGKRGGARIIYYFHDEDHPIYLLFAYTKDIQADLNDHEKKILRNLVQQLKNSFRNKEVRPNG